MTSKSTRTQDIAVIGMAIRLAEADDPQQFLDNLRGGRDGVRELTAERKQRTSLPAEEDYRVSGFMDDIDTFDHAFFGISKGEAQHMAPEHRLVLQVAYQAVENGGYDPETLRGMRASVYVGDTKLEYEQLTTTVEPMQVMGTHVAAIAGRVSRFLGLRGPSAMVDSACSSSLLAVNMAVNDLLLGEAELALACGANLSLFPDRRAGEPDIGIRSEDGKTRCFSADADGTGSGEAVAAVMLKPLDKALRDGDLVHAVIKGVAVNHVAGRSSTLTAPDSTAQAEVLELAWEKAGVDPATISYIEAHGTATRLGDPIEIEAIDLAFGKATARKHFCALSSVKSNVGHTWSASGIVGLIKTVLALRQGELFPNLHSEHLSPFIDFAGSAVDVTRDLSAWEPDCGVRRAGVSSFGVMGTNVHAILEEAPARAISTGSLDVLDSHWIPVSAKSVASLEANLAELKRWIDRHPGLDLRDVQRTLAGGRGHFPHRFAVTVGSLAELSDALTTPEQTYTTDVVTALVVSGRCTASAELTASLRQAYPHFDQLYRQCELTAAEPGPHLAGFAFQYAFSGLLRHLGLDFRHVVGEGAGKHVIAASAGRVDLAEALRLAGLEHDANAEDLDARVDRLGAKLGDQRVLFVEAGPLSTVSRALAARGKTGHAVAAPDAGFAAFLSELYVKGATWDWRTTAGDGLRIELPSYQFQKIHCWLENVTVPAVSAPTIAALPAAPVDTLEAVSRTWKDILALDELAQDASFFELGGDSINGTQVINRLQTLYGIELEYFAIFDYDTPAELAQYVDEVKDAQQAAETPLAVPRSGTEPFPVSPAQLHVWLASQFEGGSVAFNLTRTFRLTGVVDTVALRRALDALAERHDAFRTVFTFADGELTQRVLPADRFTIPLKELADGTELPNEVRVTELVRKFASRPFDLAQGPLLRAQLISFAAGEHILTCSTHHIVADGWSLELLTRDLAAFYASFARATPLALPAIDVAYRDHHRQEDLRVKDRRDASAAYWLARFEDTPPVIDLPLRTGVGGAAFSGAYRDYVLAEPLWERLKAYSQQEGGTVFVSLLSAFAALLSRYTEHGDMVLGTSVAGRNRESAEQLVGMLVRTLPLRLDVDASRGFSDLFDHVRSAFGDAVRHPDYLYEELVGELQERGLAPSPQLFNVLIEFEQFADSGLPPLDAMAGPDLAVTRVEMTLETSVVPLNIMMAGQAGVLDVSIRFDTRMFDEHTIDQLWTSFTELLETMLDRPTEPLSHLPLLGEDEQLRVRTLGHREFAFESSVRIHHAVERFAVRTPDRVCLTGKDDERTFAQLNTRANRLARYFADELGVRPGEVVALVMDRSILMVESILALWKCGAAYLPIDPGYPAAFVASMVETSKVRVVALDPTQVSTELAAQIPATARVVELTGDTAADLDGTDLGVTTDDSSIAYVIYTSGSTGVPKGVMVEHLGMLNHLHAKIDDLTITDRSVVAQNASNSFDISVWQMFSALFAGGRTTIYEEALQLDPIRFAARLAADEVTVLEVVPSYLETLLDAWGRADRPITLATLEFLLVTGEAAFPSLVNRWLERFPGVPVVNAYGPTEASDDITHHLMTGLVETESVPIGSPIHNTLIYVLDEHLRVLPQGMKGDIYVSGIGVGRGYLHAPEQTARVFTTDPFVPGRRMYATGDTGRWTPEATLEFFGRTDSQVKVRGFRIDLGEIERRVAECPGVRTAAVVTGKDTADQLCAYVVLDIGGSLDECREHLHRELPHYMVPADFVELPRLPLTSNGKVDRQELRRLGVRRPGQASAGMPATEAEKSLTEIWQQVLGRDGIGVSDRFFDLGGNSLRAIQVLSRVRGQLGVELTLENLFSQPTIVGLAALVPSAPQGAVGRITSLGGAGIYEPAVPQHLLLEIERASAQPEAFNRNDLLDVLGDVDPARLERAFALVVERHESLRTTFAVVEGKAMQVVHEPGALALGFDVHDFSQEADPSDAARRFAEHRIGTPFDVAAQSLVRADLLRTGSDEYALVVSMHQLICDGRSAEVLFEDWIKLYGHLSAGEDGISPALSLQYKDIAHWSNDRMSGERLREHREFWAEELDGASSLVPLRTDFPRPAVAAFTGARLRLPVPAALTARLTALASQHGVTEFVLAQCAVSLVLLAETGGTDVTIGTYTRGRGRLDVEDQIGCHINTVPLRFRLAPEDDVHGMLARAQQAVLRAFQHEYYPYGWTMRDQGWSRGPERTPLFDVMVAMDEPDEPAGDEPRPALRFEPRVLSRRAKEADLLFVFERPSDGLDLAITYNTELFCPGRVEEIAARLLAVLETMADDRPVIDMVQQKVNQA